MKDDDLKNFPLLVLEYKDSNDICYSAGTLDLQKFEVIKNDKNFNVSLDRFRELLFGDSAETINEFSIIYEVPGYDDIFQAKTEVAIREKDTGLEAILSVVTFGYGKINALLYCENMMEALGVSYDEDKPLYEVLTNGTAKIKWLIDLK